MLEFPEFLPKPLLLSVRSDSGVTAIQSEMESGPKRLRPKLRSKRPIYTLQWIFTKPEFDKFQYWFRQLLASGTLEFTLLMVSGAGLNQFRMRFTAPWSSQIQPGLRFQVSATVEVLFAPIWDQAAYDAYIEYGDAIVALEEQFDQIVTFELPQEF